MSAMALQLVIIERDGVINERVPGSVTTPELLNPLAGSLEAIARLNHAGMRVAVSVTHPETGTTDLPIETLNRIHARLQQLLARRGGHLDGLFIHNSATGSPAGNSPVRELLQDIAGRFSIPLEQTAFVSGDPHLLACAQADGATAILVQTGPTHTADLNNLKTAADLMAAADEIIRT